MIRFGAWSTLLAIGALYGVTVAILLGLSRRNVEANRILAALIFVIVLKLAPYILGFAGFYDAYPRLSFAPFDLGLAIGPLLWLYLQRLTHGAAPSGWWRHLLPAVVQLVYGLVLLPMPLDLKNAWDDHVHAPWIDPAETGLEAISVATYLLLAWRRRCDYQNWLDDHVSHSEEQRLTWLRNFILALSFMLAVWAPYEVLAILKHLNYHQRFPLYVALTVLVFYLGLEGWRHANDHYALSLGPAAPASLSNPIRAVQRDWRREGQRWLDQMAAAGWWRDPELNLERLARQLGTNSHYLSRAFNEGLGMSFNDVVNKHRVSEMKRCLSRPDEKRDVLALAVEAGFSSKTSFNRIFKMQTGQTPTEFRHNQRSTSTNS